MFNALLFHHLGVLYIICREPLYLFKSEINILVK